MDEKIGKIKFDDKFKYSTVRMLIGKKETDKVISKEFPYHFISSRRAKKYEAVLSNFDKLQPGDYIVLIQVDWH